MLGSRRITQAGPGPGEQVVSRSRQAADIGSARRSRRTRGRARGMVKAMPRANQSAGRGELKASRRGQGMNGSLGESAVWSRGAPFAETKAALEAWFRKGVHAPSWGFCRRRRRRVCVRSAEGMWPDGQTDGGGTAQAAMEGKKEVRARSVVRQRRGPR